MNNGAYISFNDLRKTYIMGRQKVHALDGVNLSIEKGSFTVVMGPSGSGKSTLLYLLGGLDRLTSGEIFVDGNNLELLDENHLGVYRRKTIGFIFQSFNLISSMTALQNVIFPMRFSGVPGPIRQKRAAELLKQVGLEKRQHHKPTELSGGQQQRVAVARSLVNNPPIILADEPTGNLDTQSSMEIMRILKQLNAEGRTIVVVSHDPRMRQFADRLVFILDGKIVTESEFEKASSFVILDENEEG